MKLAKFAMLWTIVAALMVISTHGVNAATNGGVWCGAGGFWGNITSSLTTANPSINTALGCIPIKPDKFMEWLLPWILGIGGGVSFLLMVYGFFLMMTSSGDPKAVQAAQETVTSAIMGLLVSVFALFILRLIAMNILVIPGI